MVETTLPGGPRQYLRVFRHHVLDPLSDAQARLTREREEVDAEREAFRDFQAAVADVRPVPASSATRSPVGVTDRPDQVTLLEDAYRSTVMSVPHYEEVYAESLPRNMLAELGDPAAAIVHSTSATVTQVQKSALLAAIERAIEDRSSYIGVLEAEDTSLSAATSAIEDIIDSLDDVVIQDWYRAEFEAELNDIVRERQTVVHGRLSSSSVEGRSLCTHIYADQPWTFPVLTAVARLHDAVVVD